MASEDVNQDAGQNSAVNDDVLDPVKQLGLLDKSLDNAFEQILSKMSTQDDTIVNNINGINLRDFANNIKSSKNKNNSNAKELKEKVQGLDESLLQQLEGLSIPKERLDRYNQYSQLPYELYLATRMVQVYLDNILIKNPYTKQFLDIIGSEYLDKDNSVSDTDKQVLLKTAKVIFAYFDIQKRLKNDILPKQLVLGNFFVEIINLNKFDYLNNKANSMQLITEQFMKPEEAKVGYKSHKYGIELEIDLLESYHEYIEEQINTPVAATELDFDRQLQMLMESKSDDVSFESKLLFEDINSESNTVGDIVQSIRSLDLNYLKYINLKYISPENVIILEKNGNKYGYLILEGNQARKSPSGNNKDEYNFLQYYQKAFSTGYSSSSAQQAGKDENPIDSLLTNVFKKIRHKNGVDKVSELMKIIGNESNIHALKSMLYDMYNKFAKVTVRYVPNENLVNFTNPLDKYAPYGTSIFDTVLFPAKLYTIGLLSSIISRMNRASVVRKWTIEAGSHRNHAELIEKFKKELRNQTVSFDDIMKLKDVTQTVSDFKDFVTISQDGKRFVDFEIMPMHDRSLPINELETLKSDLVAASGIPSPMLGITDTYDLREQIVNVNIIFATKIDTFQTFINEALETLVNGVLKQLFILNNKKQEAVSLSRYVDIKLNPPLVLVLQHLESTLSSATNIINLLNQASIPVDPVWMLKRFIKIIDWDAVKQSGIAFQNEQQLHQAIQQEVQNVAQQAMPSAQGGGGGF